MLVAVYYLLLALAKNWTRTHFLTMSAFIHLLKQTALTTLAVWSHDPDTTRFSPRVWIQSTEYTYTKARRFCSSEVMKR